MSPHKIQSFLLIQPQLSLTKQTFVSTNYCGRALETLLNDIEIDVI